MVQIGTWQLFTMFVNLVFGKAIGYSSEVMTRKVGHDSWISMIIAFGLGFLMMLVVVWLARRYPDQQPTTYLPKLIGRFPAAVAMLLLAVFFLISYVTSAITIEQHLNDYLMTETPLLVFVVVYGLVIAFAVHIGLEVAARLSVLAFILAVLMDLLLVAGSIDHLRIANLLPVFDYGVGPVFAASAGALPDVAMATTAALMLLPLAQPVKTWTRVTLWGIVVGMLVTALWTVFEIGVMGAEVTAQYLIACMQMARAAELSIYLHRYELLMVALWTYSVVTQSVICLYSAVEMTREALPFKINRLFVTFGLAAVAGVVQYFLAYDRDVYGDFLAGPWPAFVIPVAFGLPLLFAVVALFRRPGRTSGASGTSGTSGTKAAEGA